MIYFQRDECMEPYEGLWSLTESCGALWRLAEIYGGSWSLQPHGGIWSLIGAVRKLMESCGSLWLFLVCFQARGAPGEGQVHIPSPHPSLPPKNPSKPMEKLRRPFLKAPWPGKSPDGPFWAIEQLRKCYMAVSYLFGNAF